MVKKWDVVVRKINPPVNYSIGLSVKQIMKTLQRFL